MNIQACAKDTPKLRLKTKEISSSHNQGKHTTTYAEMFDLDSNIRVIDTPGIRGFGLVDISKYELGDFFPEPDTNEAS